jgi:hypothetical protein
MEADVLARGGEELTHARGAAAHEHLHELRCGDGEERHARLARHRPRQQRLARTRRSYLWRARPMFFFLLSAPRPNKGAPCVMWVCFDASSA